jgi:hypothetical protein
LTVEAHRLLMFFFSFLFLAPISLVSCVPSLAFLILKPSAPFSQYFQMSMSWPDRLLRKDS